MCIFFNSVFCFLQGQFSWYHSVKQINNGEWMYKCQLINRWIIKSHVSYMQLDWLISLVLLFIFYFIHLQNVKMFTCNVFRMFFVFCVLMLQFFVITTLLTDCRGTGAFLSSFVHMNSMASLYWVGCLFLMWLARPVVPVPFLLLLSPGDHFMRCLQAVPSAAFTRHRTFLSLMVGANLLTYRQTQAVNFPRLAIGGWIVTETLLLLSLTVVSAVFGGCKAPPAAHHHPPD